MDAMLNYAQAAEILGLPVGTLYAMVAKRNIPHIRLGRRLVRFSREALERWVKEHAVETKKSAA